MGKAINPCRCFNSVPEVIRAAVMLYIRYPLSLRNVEDLFSERGSIYVTKRSGSGGTVLGRYFPPKSGDDNSARCADFVTGDGMLTRCR